MNEAAEVSKKWGGRGEECEGKRGMLSEVTISAWPDFLLVMMMFLSPSLRHVTLVSAGCFSPVSWPLLSQACITQSIPSVTSYPLCPHWSSFLALDPLLPPFVGLNFTWLNGRSDQASDRWVRQSMTISEQLQVHHSFDLGTCGYQNKNPETNHRLTVTIVTFLLSGNEIRHCIHLFLSYWSFSCCGWFSFFAQRSTHPFGVIPVTVGKQQPDQENSYICPQNWVLLSSSVKKRKGNEE